jgi:hypothetical protein
MEPLTLPDSHFLAAAQGWLELGNHWEAIPDVIDNIASGSGKSIHREDAHHPLGGNAETVPLLQRRAVRFQLLDNFGAPKHRGEQERSQAMARSNKRQRSRKVEAIKVHHLIPGRDKVVDELLLSVGTSVDFSHDAELGV